MANNTNVTERVFGWIAVALIIAATVVTVTWASNNGEFQFGTQVAEDVTVDDTDTTVDDTDTVATKTYCDSEFKFGFEYPSEWTVTEGKFVEGGNPSYASQKQNWTMSVASSNEDYSFLVRVNPFEIGGTTLGFTQTGERKVDVAGIEFTFQEYVADSDNTGFTGTSRFMGTNNAHKNTYWITFNYPTNKAVEAEQIFEDIVKSWTFNCSPTPVAALDCGSDILLENENAEFAICIPKEWEGHYRSEAFSNGIRGEKGTMFWYVASLDYDSENLEEYNLFCLNSINKSKLDEWKALGDDPNIYGGPFSMGRSEIKTVGDTVYYLGCSAYDMPYESGSVDYGWLSRMGGDLKGIIDTLTVI
ncbi:hypothetical protein ACFL1U_00150 [Patescibacteria group bacterium]